MRQKRHLNYHLLKAGPVRACLSLLTKRPRGSIKALILLFVFSISVVIAVPFQQVNAATKTSDLSTVDMAKSFAAYRWLRSCMDRGNFSGVNAIGMINQENVNNYKWFSGSGIGLDINISTAGVINEPDDGDLSCTQDEGVNFIGAALGLWGYSSGAEFLCDIGFTREVGNECTNIASSGSNNFKRPDGLTSKLDNWWKNKLGNNSNSISSIAIGGEYSLYLQSFLAKCGTQSENGEYSLQTFTSGSATPQETRYTAVNKDFTKTSGNVRLYQEKSMTCGEIADKINNKTDDAVLNYIKYLGAHGNADAGSNQGTACPEGATEASCTTAGSSCVVEGIGWIICPVMNFSAGIVDAAYGFVASLLTVQPLLTTGDNAGVYEAWKIMRTIANLAFVIVFLIIIFSQLSNVGVSNYGVKKMLPRLIIGAILVNLSFWVCAVAVDLSNIIGSSMISLFDTVGASIPAKADINIADSGEGWTGIVGAVLAGGALAGAIYYVGLSALIPALLAALVAVITVFLVLTLRQALIILLIVIAPLAFVAYLLPNTEDWFTKWRKFLTTLLLMFPIIAAIFGASALASKIVMNSSGDAVIQIMGACIAIIPLALTPIVMKTAGGVLNRFGGMVNNREKGPIDNLRKAGGKYREGRSNLRNARALNGAQQGGRGAFVRWRARRGAVSNGRQSELNHANTEYVADKIQTNNAFRNSVAGGTIRNAASDEAQQRALASSINAKAKLEIEEVNAASVVLKNAHLNLDEMRTIASGGAVSSSNGINFNGATSRAVRAASIQQTVASNDVAAMNTLWSESRNWKDEDGAKLRQVFADSLQGSSARPSYLSQGAIAGLRTGEHKDIRATVEDSIKNNTYSAEKIASADKEELNVVAQVLAANQEASARGEAVAISDDQHQKILLNTEQALTDPRIRGSIGKNLQQVENIYNIRRPSDPIH